MGTTYCATHHRALIPAGYDLRKRVTVPAHWHPMSAHLLLFAAGVLISGGCTVPSVVEAACDVCEREQGGVPCALPST